MSEPLLSSDEVKVRKQNIEDFFVQIGNEKIFANLKQTLLSYLETQEVNSADQEGEVE